MVNPITPPPDAEVKCKNNRLMMGKIAPSGGSKQNGIQVQSQEFLENLGEELRQAIWPVYNHDIFCSKVQADPEIMDYKSGSIQETLLHRWKIHFPNFLSLKQCLWNIFQGVSIWQYWGRSCSFGDWSDAQCWQCQRCHTFTSSLSIQTLWGRQSELSYVTQTPFCSSFFQQLLIESGANVCEKDHQGDEPIHSAAKSGCVDLLHLLIDHGAQMCIPGHQKNTVKHYAAKYGRVDLIQFLIKKGCPAGLRNALNETPLHLAAGYYTRGKMRF